MKPSKITKEWAKNVIKGERSTTLSYGDVSDRNLASTSSFNYDAFQSGLKNTQQLNVDWSDFSSHTFFNSGEAKVNVAFDKIIQEYPFDGDRIEVERFFETLTGFEKYVFNRFPVYSGSLTFSASQALGNLTSSYLSVQDVAGAQYPGLTKRDTGLGVLDPALQSFSVELHVNPSSAMSSLPTGSGKGTWFINKFDTTLNKGFIIYGDRSSSDNGYMNAKFIVHDGTSYLSSSLELQYDTWSQACFVLQRLSDTDANTQCYLNGVLVSSSSVKKIDTLSADASFWIASGSAHPVGTTSGLTTGVLYNWSGSIDELRFYHSVRSPEQQRLYMNRNVYASDDLRLYYRCNEPPPPLTSNYTDTINSILIDHSGNGIHGIVSNWDSLGSGRSGASTLLYAEPAIVCPVLFPAYPDIVTLNSELLTSGSQYDIENPNLITKLVPPHYFAEANSSGGWEVDGNGDLGAAYSAVGSKGPRDGKKGSATLLLTFLYTYAKFFDEIKLFIDAFSTLNSVDYDTAGTVPDNFVYDLLKRYGFDYSPKFGDASIEQYVEGQNITLDQYSRGDSALKTIQSGLLRHLVINLPDIIKSKGTQHSIRAFLRSVGIDPDNSVRIRETGGPTERVLGTGREHKTTTSYALTFVTGAVLSTAPLSASGGRREVGYPELDWNSKGADTTYFVEKEVYHPHGIVFDSWYGGNIGPSAWITSGSFSIEADYRFLPSRQVETSQSLMKLVVSGSDALDGVQKHCILNLVALSASVSSSVTFGISSLHGDGIDRIITGSLNVDIFDGDWWRVGFSRVRSDDPRLPLGTLSSSYRLYVGKRDATGGVAETYSMTTYAKDNFNEIASYNINVLQAPEDSEDSTDRAPILQLGSGSYMSPGTIYLNQWGSTDEYSKYLTNNLEADVHALKMYSYGISDAEWQEHLRNPFSAGSESPHTSWNYDVARSGSFQRLRLDTLTRPDSTGTGTGVLYFNDMSENGFYMTGSGFSTLSSSMNPVIISHSYLSPYIDEAVSDDKVRIRSFQEQANVDATPWAVLGPMNELPRSERPADDTRFSVDFSLIDALNRDIIKMFGTLDYMQTAIGTPETQYSPDYPDLTRLSDLYFNRVKADLNFKAFFEFYRWFDRSIAGFIEQLVPRKTRFRGTNFVIESHILERGKLEYYSSEMYLRESDRSSNSAVVATNIPVGTVI